MYRLKAALRSGQSEFRIGRTLGGVEWSLTVTERGANAEQGRELWSSVFHYDGYDGGILALDGTSFVTVSFWYWTESPVVTIYRDGEIHSLRGRAFRIPRRKLVETVSHRLWLSQDKKPYGLVGTDRMLINTIDGQQHVVDLTTGMLVNDE